MKKRWLTYVIFGLVLYLLFLVVEMPASWFAWGLNKFSRGAVRLDPIAGSLWRGNGRLVIYYPQTTPHDLGNVRWNVNPIWLFTGQMQTSWQADAPDMHINTTLRISPGKVTLLDTDAGFPAQSVDEFYPPAALISPQGTVQFHIPGFAIGRDGITGSADVQWQNAGSSLTTIQPLGDYRLEIIGAGKSVDLKLSTLRGALELSGQGQWQPPNGQFKLSGFATPRERAGELEPLLKLLGSDEGGGRRVFTANGKLPLIHLISSL